MNFRIKLLHRSKDSEGYAWMRMGAHLNQALGQALLGDLPASKETAYHRA
jgi:hypothetical protein